jgi:hypothetical protein
MIGGILVVNRNPLRGTTVTCNFPIKADR